jgi:4'-phosphopantetheinyl transferase
MPIPLTDVPAIAARLDPEALHVWRLHYDPRRGRAPLRALLGAYLGVPGEAVELSPGAHGRPRLAGSPAGGLDFNWTHSGDCALVALARQIAPGIDVERRRARPRGLEIARRYFAPEEAAWLAEQPPEHLDEAFLALWTAKEAVLKALGRGLAFGMHRLAIGSGDEGLRLLRLEHDETARWQLQPLAVDPEHVAALAWRGAPRHVSQWVLAGDG